MKKQIIVMLSLICLIIGLNTGCDKKDTNNYKETAVVRGDIVDGLIKEGSISVGTADEIISFEEKSQGETGDSNKQTVELKYQLQIEEVYAVPGLAVNKETPVIKLTDESVKECKEMLEMKQKEAERAASFAEMERDQKSLDAEYAYQKDIAGGQSAKEKRDLTLRTLENNIKQLQEAVDACQKRINQLQGKADSTAQLQLEKTNLSNLQLQLQTAKLENESKKVQAEQEYEQAQLDYTYAEDKKNNATKSLDEAVDAAKENLNMVKKEVEQFEKMIGDGTIKASCEGVVIAVNCKENQTLPLDQTIITYADNKQITMTVPVSQSEILAFHVGDEAVLKLDVYKEEPIAGEIVNLEPNVSSDETEEGYKVTVRALDNEKRIYADMTGKVVLTEKAVKDILIIPVEAVIREKTISYVKMYGANGDIEKIEVKTGFSDGEMVEITSGLDEGEKVLILNTEEKVEDNVEETK